MNNSKLLEYLQEKEKATYFTTKEHELTMRWIWITLIICLFTSICFTIFFVVPKESETITADNGSQIVQASTIGRDNNNGM